MRASCSVRRRSHSATLSVTSPHRASSAHVDTACCCSMSRLSSASSSSCARSAATSSSASRASVVADVAVLCAAAHRAAVSPATIAETPAASHGDLCDGRATATEGGAEAGSCRPDRRSASSMVDACMPLARRNAIRSATGVVCVASCVRKATARSTTVTAAVSAGAGAVDGCDVADMELKRGRHRA